MFKCKKFPVAHEKHHEQCAGFSHGHKHGAEEGSLSSWTAKLQDLLKGSTFQQGWLSTHCRSEFIILAIKSKSSAALKKNGGCLAPRTLLSALAALQGPCCAVHTRPSSWPAFGVSCHQADIGTKPAAAASRLCDAAGARLALRLPPTRSASECFTACFTL